MESTNLSHLAFDTGSLAATSAAPTLIRVLLRCAATCVCGLVAFGVASFYRTAFRLRAFRGPLALPLVGNLYDLSALKVRARGQLLLTPSASPWRGLCCLPWPPCCET